MSEVQRFLLTIRSDPQEAAHISDETARRLQSKDVKLLDVVQSMGEYLTDDDATVRANAVAYFAGVLGALESKFLSRQQITTSVQFFCDRIQDASGLKEAAQGLQALQKAHRFTGEEAVRIATTLFSNAQVVSQHPQGTRFTVLTLMDSLLSDQRSALKGIGEDFIVGITDLVSGEKDPRNLMIVFSMLRVVMIEWDISSHVETLFDSVFCYFPITFRPPPDDPYGITAQDLKARLRACLASTPLFASSAFPALLDKLDSTSLNVKRDVLQTITACVFTYEPETISANAAQLWDSMKFDIYNAQEEDLTQEALLTTQAIMKSLSDEMNSIPDQSPPARYLRPIITECNDLLHEPQQKQAKAAGQVLNAVASASLAAFVFVVKRVVAPLLTVYQDAGTLGKQQALLNVLDLLLKPAISFYGTWGSFDPIPEVSNPLDPFKERLYEIYTRALMSTALDETSFRLAALKGLNQLAALREYLDNAEIEMIVQYLDDILLNRKAPGQDELRSEAVKALIHISKMKPNLVMDITFPAFMSRLPDTDKDMPGGYLSSLEVLAEISVEEHMFELLLRRLLNKLDSVLRGDSSPAYPCAILSALFYALNRKDLENDPRLEMYFDKLVARLIQKVTQPLQESSGLTVLNDESVLHVIGKLTNVIVRALPSSRQQEIARSIYTSFLPASGSIRDLSLAQPLHRRIIIVSTYLVAGIRREVSVCSDISDLFNSLVDWCMHETDSPTRTALLVQICLLANKWLTPSHGQMIHGLSEKLVQNIGQDLSDPQHKEVTNNSLRILLWLTKGTILRLDPLTTELLDLILGLLSHSKYGLPTARGFSALLAPHELLTSSNFVTTRLLHKQRVFCHCIPQLASDFRKADLGTKPNYLIALAGILRYVPTEAIIPQLETLLPLLLQSLDLPDPDVKDATIDTLIIMIRESPKAAEGYISSLIARLLASASSTETSNPSKVRIAALQCLRIFPSVFRHELLLPSNKKLVKDLIPFLDDPKRDVRKEAVDCRSAWLRMDDADAG